MAGDGTDELSIAAPSAVVRLANGAITEGEISPEDAGLPVHPFAAIVGGSRPRLTGRRCGGCWMVLWARIGMRFC